VSESYVVAPLTPRVPAFVAGPLQVASFGPYRLKLMLPPTLGVAPRNVARSEIPLPTVAVGVATVVIVGEAMIAVKLNVCEGWRANAGEAPWPMRIPATSATETKSAQFLLARGGCESGMGPTSHRDRFISDSPCGRPKPEPPQKR
jgi:hypothetical protein